MVEGEFKFSACLGRKFSMKDLILQAAPCCFFFFLNFFFAVSSTFGRCFHNLRVKLKTLFYFQINLDFNLAIRKVFISKEHF